MSRRGGRSVLRFSLPLNWNTHTNTRTHEGLATLRLRAARPSSHPGLFLLAVSGQSVRSHGNPRGPVQPSSRKTPPKRNMVQFISDSLHYFGRRQGKIQTHWHVSKRNSHLSYGFLLTRPQTASVWRNEYPTLKQNKTSKAVLCKSWGFHGGDSEQCRLLWYQKPVRTSKETHYVSTTEPSQIMLCKIWGFHGGDYEECRLLGY
jgi:hypothetical protein